MGNYSHKAVTVGKSRQGIHGLCEGFFVEGAETFVNEHSIEFYPAG